MNDKKGVGVTVISHDSESRTLLDGCEPPGCYSRDIHYTGASLSQLASLTKVSSHCEQFIKFECHGSLILPVTLANISLGGCHVTQLTWRTGAEHLAVVAHVGKPNHAHTPVVTVTVMRTTMYGVKTAASSLISHSFQ